MLHSRDVVETKVNLLQLYHQIVTVFFQEFLNLSMSSQNWTEMEFAAPNELPKYIESLKASGYVVVGAEQV